GGVERVRSYGGAGGGPGRPLADYIPERHRRFLAACRPYHETATHLFVHGGYEHDLPMEAQRKEALFWRVTDARTALPHFSGKTAVVGHTPQPSGEGLDLGFLTCIDTNCPRGGWLTALDGGSGRVGPGGHDWGRRRGARRP